MKKIICILLCIIFLCSQAFAMPSVTINNETRLMNINGVSEVKSGTVSVTVVKEKDPHSIGAMSDASLFYELETNSSGSYGGKFYLPASAPLSSYYNVYVSGDSEPGRIYRSSPTEIDDCINDISAASSDEEIDSLLRQYVGVLGINLEGDYEQYSSWSQKLIYQQVKKTVPTQISDIITYFDKANEGAKLINGNSSTVQAALGVNLLGNTIDSSLSVASIADMYVTSRTNLSLGTTTDVLSQIKKDLKIACALVKINSSTKGVMTTVLEEYNDVLELNLTGDYAKLSKVEVNKALVSKGFTSVKAVQDAFSKSVLAVKNSNTSGSPSSSPISGPSTGHVISKVEMPSESVNPYENFVPFNDISGVEWAKNAITSLYMDNIISGYEDGSFRPDNNVTRAEFTKLVVSLIADDTSKLQKEKIKVAAVGDSLTQGAVDNDGKYKNECSYTYTLQSLLGDSYEVGNFGRSSHGIYSDHAYPYLDTTDYANSLVFKPDVVVSMFGTNDCKAQYWGDIKANYKEMYKDFINSYKEVNPNVKIIICIPTPIFDADNDFKKDRPDPNPAEMREAVKSAADELGAFVVDAYTPFINRSTDFPDGLHYNRKGASDFARLVSEAILEDKESSGRFYDVNENDWYSTYIEKAVSNSIVTGYGDSFMPNNNITREDAAVIIYRLISSKLSSANTANFVDDYAVSDYAKVAVGVLAGNSLINGMDNGKFEPKGMLTRAQAAVLIKASLEKMK